VARRVTAVGGIPQLAVIGRFLLDALAPHRCVNCKKIGAVVCVDCWKTVDRKLQVTPGPNPLQSTVTCAEYEQPIIQKLIHDLKYNSIRDAAKPLAELLTESVRPLLQPGDVIVAIPLHPRRERKRGFNQSELLAKQLCSATAIPLAHILHRTRNTKPQVECEASERRTNLKDAFVADLVDAKRIILIDDVTTTGTTFVEAAKALRKVTAVPIIGLAVARGG
ncbi:MAG: ComF family protein, partial [Patescibacteria group bacterium]